MFPKTSPNNYFGVRDQSLYSEEVAQFALPPDAALWAMVTGLPTVEEAGALEETEVAAAAATRLRPNCLLNTADGAPNRRQTR
jgi:hypothetical protein